MSDIVERLRQVAAAYKSLPTSGIWATMTVDRDASCNNLTEAADEIERLRAEVAGLRKALAAAIRQNEHDMLMTGEELRAARAALGDKTPTTPLPSPSPRS